MIGIPYHDNDFGITLGQNGVQEGSYLVLPFVGPMPPRDLLGSAVDGVFDPFNYARFSWPGHLAVCALGPADPGHGGPAPGRSLRASNASSVDFYATTRNLYRQSRDARIRGEDIHRHPAARPLKPPGQPDRDDQISKSRQRLGFWRPSPYIPPCISMGLARCLFCQRIQWDGPEDALWGSGSHAQ